MIFKDLVLLSVSGNPGLGDVVISGAVTHYMGMGASDDGNVFDLTIYDCDANGTINGNVEVIADVTYVHGSTTFSRNTTGTVLTSSNSNAKVNFSSGTQRVVVSSWNSRRAADADFALAMACLNDSPL